MWGLEGVLGQKVCQPYCCGAGATDCCLLWVYSAAPCEASCHSVLSSLSSVEAATAGLGCYCYHLFHICYVTHSGHPVLVCLLEAPPLLQVEDTVQKHLQLCFTLQPAFPPLPA